LKYLLGKSAAIILVIFLFSVNALAQDATTTKIRFAKGKSSATYNGRISRTEGVQHYEFRAKAGQKVTISVSAPRNNVKFLFFASGNASQLNDDERNWSWNLEEDGDYVITVQSTKGAANFKLNISIR
jgi:membrane carboxypeptidase/penicillin-binding protein PbpC